MQEVECQPLLDQKVYIVVDGLNPLDKCGRVAFPDALMAGVSKLKEGPHVRGSSGQRPRLRALVRSAQSTLRRK